MKKYLLILLLGLSSLNASATQKEKKETDFIYGQEPKELDADTYLEAWNDLGTIYYLKNGYICIQNDKALLARLNIWDYYFTPHPFSNRFNDILLDYESTFHEQMEKILSQKKRKKIAFISGFTSGLVLGLISSVVIIRVKK